MIFVQKLPTLEPEMRGALRDHILRKRQRLKQEQEQDAIEKRLKREREIKQMQDAMTLDQIKEQLSTLEKRLEALKDEKHHLFVQLKQVLNENNTKRKVESDQKKQNSSEETQSVPLTNGNTNTANVTEENSLCKTSVSNSCKVQDLTSASRIQPTSIRLASSQSSPSTPPRTLNQAYSSHPSTMVGAPILPIHSVFSNPSSSNSRPIFSSKLPYTEVHPQYRPPIVGSVPPELMGSAPLDFGHHRMQQAHFDHRSMFMDIPMSLATNQHDINIITMGGKRSLNAANLNDSLLDERSIARKRPTTYNYPNSNQFLINGISHTIPSLSQYNQLGQPAAGLQSTQLGTPVPSSVSNLTINNFHPRKPLPHQLGTNLDYMIGQSKQGLVVPSLNHYYHSHPHLLPPNQLHSGIETDLRNLASPYPPMTQQYNNSSRIINSQLQQEHNMRFATNINYQRKHPHQKSHYQPNK